MAVAVKPQPEGCCDSRCRKVALLGFDFDNQINCKTRHSLFEKC